MIILNVLRSTAIVASVMLCATGTHAQAALETPEDIATVIEACVVVTAANDYAAQGQDPGIAWNRVTDRSAFLGSQGGPVTVTANVWRSETSYNSYCDFLLQDAALTQAAFDLFMVDRDPVVLDGQTGICHENAFLTVYATGPEGVQASTLGAQGYITVHNVAQYGDDPCASN